MPMGLTARIEEATKIAALQEHVIGRRRDPYEVVWPDTASDRWGG
jgi:hypothetical protein